MIRPVSPRVFFSFLLLFSAAVLGTAWGMERILGLVPCRLCLWQRVPWAVLFALSLLGLALSAPRKARVRSVPMLVSALALLAFLSLLASVILAVWHAGIEYQWWQGPKHCAGPADSSGQTLEQLRLQLLETPIIACDRPAWQWGGLSLAGYNALLSLAAMLAVASFSPRFPAIASLQTPTKPKESTSQ